MKKICLPSACLAKMHKQNYIKSQFSILKSIVKSFFPDKKFLNIVKKETNKNLFIQIWQRLLLVIFYRMEPDAYYITGLYDNDAYEFPHYTLSFRQCVNINNYLLSLFSNSPG